MSARFPQLPLRRKPDPFRVSGLHSLFRQEVFADADAIGHRMYPGQRHSLHNSRVRLPSSVEQLLTPTQYGGGVQLSEPSNNINYVSYRQRRQGQKKTNSRHRQEFVCTFEPVSRNESRFPKEPAYRSVRSLSSRTGGGGGGGGRGGGYPPPPFIRCFVCFESLI